MMEIVMENQKFIFLIAIPRNGMHFDNNTSVNLLIPCYAVNCFILFQDYNAINLNFFPIHLSSLFIVLINNLGIFLAQRQIFRIYAQIHHLLSAPMAPRLAFSLVPPH